MASEKHFVILNDSCYSQIDIYVGLDITWVKCDTGPLHKNLDINIDLRDGKIFLYDNLCDEIKVLCNI